MNPSTSLNKGPRIELNEYPTAATGVLVLLLLLTSPAVLEAQFNYTTNNGAITITGYTGPGGAVTIPGMTNGLPVTGIGEDAFYGRPTVTSVTIPNSVTSIGARAFKNCSGLTSVTLPNSVTSLPLAVFENCTSLSSVAIPNSVTSIGSYAFKGCSSLANVTIGNGVTSIGQAAFEYCISLTSLTIPMSVTSIELDVFIGCISLTAITVDPSNSVYSSVAGVLFDKSRTTLIQYPGGRAGDYTIPNRVTSISDAAFAECNGLTSIMIPDSVSSIGAAAFIRSELRSVTIGRGVTSIGHAAFAECYNLWTVRFIGNAPSFGGDVFHMCPVATVYYLPWTSGWSVWLGVPTVAWYPPGLYTYAIHNGSVTITGYIGPGGAVTIPNTLDGLSVTSIGDYAFDSCTVLSGVTIPNSVTSIGKSAFGLCSNLTSLVIGNGVASVGDAAFECCTSLSGVYFQGNAPRLGFLVFYGDDNATVYYLPGTTGWGPTFGGRPTALWLLPNPLILNSGPSFGVQTNQFGFIISWATNIPVVVEACTNLANPIWSPVSTNTLTDGWSYFSDPQWTNYPARLYRVHSL